VCGGSKYAYAKTCKKCQDNSGEKNPNYRHGGAMGNRQFARARFVWLLIHRGVICERCGYNDVTVLVMHHKSRDRNDNSWGNLELLCPNCHALEHAGEWRHGLPDRLSEIHAALAAEPEHIVLDTWMEKCDGPEWPAKRKVRVRCPGCGKTRELLYHGYVKSSGFCNLCNQLRRAYGT